MNAGPSTLPGEHRFQRPDGMAAAGLGCTLLALVAGAACWCWLAVFGGEAGLAAALPCAAPALVTAGLSFTSQSDRRQYLARLVAAAAMLPMLLMMWALTEDSAAGRWTLALSVFGFIALHATCFAVLVWQLAPLTTRIEARTRTPVSADQLGRRLQSLFADGLPWRVARGAGRHEWVLDCAPAGKRSRTHRVLLNIDPLRCEVQVRERLGVSGDAPHSAEEASLRSLADDTIDAARPNAQRVWSRQLQATIIEPARVAAIRLHLIGDHAQSAGGIAADAESLVTLLAALVTRSGYAWQPVLSLRGA